MYRVHRACASRVYRVTWFIEFMRCTGLIGSIDGV